MREFDVTGRILLAGVVGGVMVMAENQLKSYNPETPELSIVDQLIDPSELSSPTGTQRFSFDNVAYAVGCPEARSNKTIEAVLKLKYINHETGEIMPAGSELKIVYKPDVQIVPVDQVQGRPTVGRYNSQDEAYMLRTNRMIDFKQQAGVEKQTLYITAPAHTKRVDNCGVEHEAIELGYYNVVGYDEDGTPILTNDPQFQSVVHKDVWVHDTLAKKQPEIVTKKVTPTPQKPTPTVVVTGTPIVTPRPPVQVPKTGGACSGEKPLDPTPEEIERCPDLAE